MPHRSSSMPLICFVAIGAILPTTFMTLFIDMTNAYAQNPIIYEQIVALNIPPKATQPLKICHEAIENAEARLKILIHQKHGIRFPKNFHFLVTSISYVKGSCAVTLRTTVETLTTTAPQEKPVFYQTR